MALRRRRGDDRKRLDEGKTEVGSTRSETARSGVGERSEMLRSPARSVVAAAVDMLRKKGGKGVQKVRQIERELYDHKWVA